MSFSRETWRRLRGEAPMTLDEPELAGLRGLNSVISVEEVVDIYLPLSRLLELRHAAAHQLSGVVGAFLQREDVHTPFIIGMAGSVAVGKSTAARVLHALISRWPSRPRVELITTDGFLLPNAELRARDLMERKGFPESYDRSALLDFIAALKAGARRLRCPRYSHLIYDVLPDDPIIVEQPDIVIFEGLNVLQPSPHPGRLFVSDFFDFSIYLDAEIADLRRWYIARFRTLRDTAFRDPDSYFHRYTQLSDQEADDLANGIWERINEANLLENILPTRERAALILQKGPNHQVHQIHLRKR